MRDAEAGRRCRARDRAKEEERGTAVGRGSRRQRAGVAPTGHATALFTALAYKPYNERTVFHPTVLSVEQTGQVGWVAVAVARNLARLVIHVAGLWSLVRLPGFFFSFNIF